MCLNDDVLKSAHKKSFIKEANILSNTEKRLMNFGIFIFNIILFTVVASTVIFIFGGSISELNICLGVVGSIIFCFFTTKKSAKETVIISVASILLLALLMFICANTYEWTCDGNTYRKSMIGLMKLGWNPLLESFYTAAEPYDFLSICTQTWYDAYPKATEIFAASVYSLTENIESGKCFTLLAMVGAFAVCMSYLIGTGKLKKWQSGICAAVCIWNPVNLSQCFTFYNDAFLGILLLICTAAMMNLTFFEHKKLYMRDYWLIFLTINLGFNSKFSALIFFAILCLAFFFYWIFEKCKKEGWKKGKRDILERFCVFAISVLSGVLFLGSTSYVTNTIRYRNPVYTMIGEGSTEIITSMAPKAIREMSHIERFFVSLFSATGNDMALEQVQLKPPFDFTNDSMYDAGVVDVRLAGWGIFFTGVLVVSLIVLGKIFYDWKKRNPKALVITAILAAVFAILIIFVPGMFWARYFTLLFWIPAAAVVLAFIEINEGRSKGLLCGALLALMLVNTVPNINYISDRFEEFEDIDNGLNVLKAQSQSHDIILDYRTGPGEQVPGQFFNFIDKKVKHQYTQIGENQNVKYLYGLRIYLTESENEPDKLSEYLASRSDNLIIFVAAKDDASRALNDDTISSMRNMGLTFDLPTHFRYSYLAIIDDGKVIYEGVSEDAQAYKYKFGSTKAKVSSAGYEAGNKASIIIENKNYSCNMRGLNFVIYDKETKTVVDSFYMDTCNDNLIRR